MAKALKAVPQAASKNVNRAPSKLRPGKGSPRVKTTLTVLYGPPKARKTTSCSTIPGAKWLVSDSNCVGVETQFITALGVKSFREFDGGEKLNVLTHTGKWRSAIVRRYGKQALREVVVGRGPNRQVVRATDTHRWLLEDARTVTTAQLQVGDKLLKPPHHFQIVMGFSNSPVAPYIVRSVGEASEPEETWCLEVDTDESFILPSGVVTRNCVSTLRDLNRLPADEDIYEVGSLAEAREFISDCLKTVDAHGPDSLGCTAIVVDSITQFADWHKEDVARATGQRFLGDNDKNNGWNHFNAEFGYFLNDLASLSRYTPTIIIAHAGQKLDTKKGAWAGISLPPQMSEKLARLANRVLYQAIREYTAEDGKVGDEFVSVEKRSDGSTRAVEVIIHTRPVGAWIASAPPHYAPEEPADMAKLLEKDGLL